jgi:hypothetical protein
MSIFNFTFEWLKPTSPFLCFLNLCDAVMNFLKFFCFPFNHIHRNTEVFFRFFFLFIGAVGHCHIGMNLDVPVRTHNNHHVITTMFSFVSHS